jgi:acyl-CoA oxidase
MVKLVVNSYLFGAAVFNLGTERHHRLLKDIETFKLPGCFCMTELGHGSNVRKLQTTATYDRATKEFVINTPSIEATKWWIGNAAHAKIACVFGQLIIDDVNHGVHGFLVPIRTMDEKHEILPGITIRDCGNKFGINGVDNGALTFTNVRIPATNLLDKFGGVSEDGTYSSPIKSLNKRFANILNQMLTGRIGITYASNTVLKIGVYIAVKYSTRRRQFGPTDTGTEVRIQLVSLKVLL